MRKVSIVFYNGNSWVSKVIKWFTRSKVNHVALTYDSQDWGGEMTIEAAANGVICHKSTRKPSCEFVITDIEAFEKIKTIVSYLGEFYDYIGILKFGIVLLWWKIFKKRIRKPLRSTNGQFCSELVARYMQSLPGVIIKNPQWVSPGDLLDICKKNPDIFIRVR
jgi:hypothetical protein